MNSPERKPTKPFDPFAFGELSAAVDSTESQREVWLASQFGDDANCAFNESVFIHLEGELNDGAIAGALEDLCARHESIRGCFSSDGYQMVFYKDRPIPLVRHNYQAHSEEDADARLKNLCKALVEEPFDLLIGPLAQFHLIRFAPQRHSLVLTFHHSVCDGWSLYIIAEELGALYTARVNHVKADLERAPSFVEYAKWERSEQTKALRDASLSYWQNQYRLGAPTMELPYDNSRPNQRSFAALRLDHELPMALVNEMKALASSQNSTLISTLMAGYVAYLHRISGGDEIVLGVPFAGQMAKEDMSLVGHCVNIIPLYFSLKGDESFQDLVTLTQSKMLDAFEHQYLTYGTLLQTIEADRDPTKPPLVSVIFNVDQESEFSDTFQGLTMNFGSNPRTFENFDINLNITLSASSAVMECTYNTGLWRETTMNRRLQELERLYKTMSENPFEPIKGIELLLPEDRLAIQQRWQSAEVTYPQSTLHGLIEESAENHPDNIAVSIEGESISYAELDRRANQLAHYLIEQGIVGETIVPMMMERSIEMVVAINGILKAGGAYLPLDPDYPLDRVEYIFEETGAQIAVIQERFNQCMPAGIHSVPLDASTEALSSYTTERPNVDVQPEQLAYVIYTSGSTGKPKGVMNEHRAASNHMLWMRDTYNLVAADKVLQKTPYTFDVSLWELFLPLISGCEMVMAKPGGHKETAYLIELINNRHISHTHFVPSMLYMFLQEANQQTCPSIKRVLASGEAVSKDLERNFKAAFPSVELWNLYGPTEAAIHVSYWLCDQEDSKNGVPIGYPLANTRLYVVDENMILQPPGVTGELLIGGVQVARGYMNRSDLTEERFIRDPFSLNDSARVYRSGDLVRMRDDGVIEYLGRNDFQVKLRGQRIELGEIESVIEQCKGVIQCVVLAREDRANDQRLVAYLTTKEEGIPDSKTIREKLRSALPDYMVPSSFMYLPIFPLTSSGKVNRKALPAPEFGELEEGDLVAAENRIEEQLVEVWCDILGLNKVGVTNDFFDLGGHSLLGTQMFARIKDIFSVNISLRKLFEAPTIRQLAEIIQEETSSGNTQAKVQPRSPEEQAIASTQQQRVWYLEQIEPDSFAYNLPASFRLQGELNISALENALKTFTQRHDLLRASFKNEAAKLVLDIHDSIAIDLTPIPLADFGAHDLDTLKRVLREEAAKPFDSSQGPLFTVKLIRFDENDHILFFLIHHLVFDGWSFDILLKEMCSLYNAYAQGLPNPLPLLSVQYPDYAIWQKAWLESDSVTKQLDYWKQKLGGDLPVLELPLDKTRPSYQAHRAEGINFYLEEALLIDLDDVGNNQGATLFMVILGLYALMLYRYSRQTDLLISVPVTARNQMEISGLVGPFVNRLVCRFEIDPQKSFSEWLKDIKKTVLEAMDNQDTQFETLVHALNPPRDAARPPLVQTLFSYQDVRNRGDQMDGILRTQVDIERMGVQTDLDVWVKRQVKGMEGGMEFPKELFGKTTARAFSDSLLNSAKQIVENPGITIGALAAASERDLTTVAEWNKTDAEYEYSDGIIGQWNTTVKSHAEKLAVSAEGQEYTYAQLDARSNQLAHYLLSKGVHANQSIGVLVHRNRDLPALLLAIWKLGAAYVPMDPSYPAERIEHILNQANVQVVVTEIDFMAAFTQASCDILQLEQDADVISEQSVQPPELTLQPDHLAYVIFTSGSTGLPKGVEVTHRALHNFIHSVREVPGISSSDRLLAITTLAFDISVLELFLPLTSGASVFLANDQQTQDGDALRQVLEEVQITIVQATPATWRYILSAGWKAPEGLKGISGGEKLSSELADKILEAGVELWNFYGPTETTVWSSAYQVQAAEEGELPYVCVGRPLANTQFHIMNDDLQPLPIGVYGELYISGANLAKGYSSDPAQTEQRFVSLESGQRLYRTGDIARWTQQGVVEVAGRIDNQIKLRGFRIELEEIESKLRAHPAIKDVAVVLQEHSDSDHRIVGYVVYHEDEEPTSSELRKHLRKSLPDYMLPRQFNVVDRIPLLASGKVDRHSLSQSNDEQLVSGQYIEPSTATEKALASIWQSSLKCQEVSVDSQFFDLGGHSLLALEVIIDIEQELGVRFSPQDMWVNTLEQLARRIDSELEIAGESEQNGAAELDTTPSMNTQKTSIFQKLFGK